MTTHIDSLAEVDRAALKHVEGEVGAALGQMTSSSETLVDAVARFQLLLDKERLLVLQNSARMLLELDLPDLDINSIKLSDKGSVPAIIWESLSFVQLSVAKLAEDMKKLSGHSVHPRVKEWSGVITTAASILYDKSEAMRWQLLELEADADISAGRVMKFASSENAAAYLRRIGK